MELSLVSKVLRGAEDYRTEGEIDNENLRPEMYGSMRKGKKSAPGKNGNEKGTHWRCCIPQ